MGEVDLFVVENEETGCNSLRPPPGQAVRRERVPMYRLDSYVVRHDIARVDFVKVDVEGGERDALLGAEAVFRRDRPTLLCEIEEIRIRPWGYDPREIVNLVAAWGYQWFQLERDGSLALANPAAEPWRNYVAQPVPSARRSRVYS